MNNSDTKPALLTRNNIEWLRNNLDISKTYEYRIKSDIRKKLKTFTELEIPFLMKKGIVESSDLSIFTQNLMTNPQINNQKGSTSTSNPEIQYQNMVCRKGCVTISVLKLGSTSSKNSSRYTLCKASIMSKYCSFRM